MAIFRVGQRVRVVKVGPNSECAHLLGKEGEVSSLSSRLDLPDVIEVTIGSAPYACITSQLEPLNPPKSQELVRWEDACFDRDGKYRQGQAA